MNHILHCLKAEVKSIRAEREELQGNLNTIISYRLDRTLIPRYKRFIKHLEKVEAETKRKVIEFEQFIENIPDAEEREMVKLYFIDLLSYEQIGERFYLERTTIARRIKKYIDAMPYFASQKTEQAG